MKDNLIALLNYVKSDLWAYNKDRGLCGAVCELELPQKNRQFLDLYLEENLPREIDNEHDPNYMYCWGIGERKPRIEWLEKQIEKFKQ